MTTEKNIEERLILQLKDDLKYTYREDIVDRDSLENNFRKKFESLNRVHLTDNEFDRLLNEIIDSDVFNASKRLREINTFIHEDGTPLQYTLVNIRDWCKNDYEVIHQLKINTRNSFQRYDVILLVNGLPLVQIELKTLDVSPRRAMQQIVEYKKMQETATPIRCFASCSFLSSATHPTPIISLTTTTNISISTQKNNICPSINGPMKTIIKSAT